MAVAERVWVRPVSTIKEYNQAKGITPAGWMPSSWEDLPKSRNKFVVAKDALGDVVGVVKAQLYGGGRARLRTPVVYENKSEALEPLIAGMEEALRKIGFDSFYFFMTENSQFNTVLKESGYVRGINSSGDETGEYQGVVYYKRLAVKKADSYKYIEVEPEPVPADKRVMPDESQVEGLNNGRYLQIRFR